jgi:RNA polymerase sigma factor (sigma-70 family)
VRTAGVDPSLFGNVTAIDVADSSDRSVEERLTSLLTANRAALRRLAASFATGPSDRDDLLQDIAMALWRALPGFRGDCSEQTFLFRIAHNRCITHVSRRREAVSLDDAKMEIEDPGTSAEATVAQEEQRERLAVAVRSLAMIYREVTVLALEGMDYKEIADVVGISESNVGVRLNRARQKLRELLEDRS